MYPFLVFVFLLLINQTSVFAFELVQITSSSERFQMQCEANKFATMSLEPSAENYNELTYKVHCLPLICIYQRTAPISSRWNIFLFGKNTTSLPESELLVRLSYVLRDENLTAAERDLKLKEYLQDGLCIEAQKVGNYPFL